jgi:hypothetical protein
MPVRARDNQKERLYRSERASVQGHGLMNLSIDQCQAYVNKVLQTPFIQSRWGRVHVQVVWTHSNGNSRGGQIALGTWARQESVILHELAHELTRGHGYASHGPEFAACYLLLVGRFMGKEHEKNLREKFKENNVRHRTGVAALPKPGTRRVVTQTAQKAASRRQATRPLDAYERRQAATLLRRAVASGVFGESGRKPRAHAQAVARALEKI